MNILTIKNILKFVATTIMIIVTLQNCSNSSVYQQNHSFEKEQWHKDSIITFNVEIVDTNQVYNLFFNTRITSQYAYSNMFLFFTTNFATNKKITDTIEYTLALPNGKWLGKGFGNVWTYKMPYRKYIKFPYVGNYTFTIEQAMRTEVLEHVLDAGISIEKVK